jgi:hypothetical protein
MVIISQKKKIRRTQSYSYFSIIVWEMLFECYSTVFPQKSNAQEDT